MSVSKFESGEWDTRQNPERYYNGGPLDFEDDNSGIWVRVFNPFLVNPDARLDSPTSHFDEKPDGSLASDRDSAAVHNEFIA